MREGLKIMSDEISLQTIDRVVRRGQEISKLLSNNYVNQVFEDNQELIGYSSEILNSLETMNRDTTYNTVEIVAAINKSSNIFSQSLDSHTEKTQASLKEVSSDILGALGVQTAILSSQISFSSEVIVDALRSIDCDIRLICAGMNEQTDIQKKTLQKLIEIHETLKHPLEVESNELLERGTSWMSKGFLSDSAKAFLQSIQKNPTNFLAHYYLGVIYLCGKNEDDDMIDLAKAEEELKLAIKYSKPDLVNNYVKQYAVMMHKSYSDLYYTKALMRQNPEQNYENAYQELMKALSIDNSIETKKCLNSRLVKCSNKTNRIYELTKYATFGFTNDYSFLSYFNDKDLINRKTELLSSIEEARHEILEKINHSLITNHTNIYELQKVLHILPQKKDYPYLPLYEVLSIIKN